MAESGLIKIQSLNETNYQTWSQEMKAVLRGKGLWRLVSEQEKKHTSDPDKQDKWDDKADKACGLLTLGVEPSQCILFQDVGDDPIKIWTTLEAAHIQKRPGTRFNAYDDFFSIRKNESESLQALVSRIETSMSKMQNLRPKNFDLKQSDEELVCMAMIRALPEEYASFTSSVLLLSTLSKSALQDAFYAEETNHRRRAMDTASGTSETVLFTKSKTGTGNTTKTCKCSPNTSCEFCEKPGHCIHECYTMTRIKKQRKEWQAAGRSGQTKDNQSANKTTTDPTENPAPSSSTPSNGQNSKTEHADKASPAASSESGCTTSDYSWNADTGASTHMTPHWHWIQNY